MTKKIDPHVRRLLEGAAHRLRVLPAGNELDAAGNQAVVEAIGLTAFDIAELGAGRITARVARLQAALVSAHSIAGVGDSE